MGRTQHTPTLLPGTSPHIPIPWNPNFPSIYLASGVNSLILDFTQLYLPKSERCSIQEIGSITDYLGIRSPGCPNARRCSPDVALLIWPNI